MISLSDRIKELSYSTGTGDFILNGAAAGFSDFGSSYSYGSILYYAISDGTRYEIGSGEYLFSTPNRLLRRYPFKSTNSNNKVDFPAGLKEVYTTYPGQKSIFTAGNYSGISVPQASGIAFWRSSQILDYDTSLIWDHTNNRLGISNSAPQYSIDVGGANFIRASGFIAGTSGVTFPQQDLLYSGGVQKEPFLRNQLDSITGTDLVFQLSGLVSEKFTFKTQTCKTFLAGPTDCLTSGYPVFRPLYPNDIPDLSSLYVTQTGTGSAGQIAFYENDRVIGYDTNLVWNKTNNYLGVNKTNPTQSLDVNGNALVSGFLRSENYIDSKNGFNTSGALFFASGNSFPVGALRWDNGEGTVALGLRGGNIDLEIGQEEVALCYNPNGVILNKGKVVYVSGVQGQRPSVVLASNALESTSSKTFGVVAENIDAGQEGFVATYGVVRNLNTSAFIEGSGLWLGTNGDLTMTKPIQPAHSVHIGYVLNSHASAGRIFVRVQNGFEIEELHNVLISGLASGDFIQYDSSVGLWKNRPFSTGGGGYTWTIRDSGTNSEVVNSGDTIMFSGVNGIATVYNPANNTMMVSGNYSWTVADPFGASEAIANANTVTFSGVDGIRSSYNPSTNIVSISGAYTAGSGISIVGNEIALSGTNIISSSGFASSAFIQTSGAFVTENSSFILTSGHNGKTILSSGTSQVNVTVSGNLPLGFGASFIQTGYNLIYCSGAPGVSIRNRQSHTKSNGLWSVVSLVQYSPTLFVLAGDTST